MDCRDHGCKVSVLPDVARERARQDAKWGEQNHPDIPTASYVFDTLEIPNEQRARFLCETGTTNWAAVLIEELAEAVQAAEDHDVTGLRAELVQIAAVAVAWVEAVDRRTGRGAGPKDLHSFGDDAVRDGETNPAHYVDHGVDCITIARHMSFNLGNALKYIWRAGKKGPAITDLRKAAWYIADEIKRLGAASVQGSAT